ncbi:hypothetical protein Tco_0864364 [Tanacetum coccineum]
MDDDFLTYEVEIPGISSIPFDLNEEDESDDGILDIYGPQTCYDENDGIHAEEVIFVNKRLVRLIDVTVEQWLDLMYGDHKKVYIKVKEEVVSKWCKGVKKQIVGVIPKGLALRVVLVDHHSKDESGKGFKLEILQVAFMSKIVCWKAVLRFQDSNTSRYSRFVNSPPIFVDILSRGPV